MSDNTQLNPGAGGDLMRTIDRSGSGPNTQVVSLDVGAAGAGNEAILRVGQQAMAASVPVVVASDQSSLNIIEPAITITGAAAQTAVVNNILPGTSGAAATDVSNYRSMSVQVVSTGTGGTFIFEQSNDNTNFRPLPVFNSELAVPVPITAAITATASQIVYTIPIRCRFIRLRIATLITGGSIQAFSRISTESWTPSVATVSQNTAANLAATVASTTLTAVTPGTAATNLGKARDSAIGATDTGVAILGVRRDTPTAETPVAGDYVVPQVSQQGALYVHPTFSGSAAASVAQVISAASTNATSVKGSAGVLTSIAAANNFTSWRYLKLHNIATAPTAGAGVVATYGIPPGGSINVPFPSGLSFSTGIGVTITGGIAAADTTAIGASEVAVSLAFH